MAVTTLGVVSRLAGYLLFGTSLDGNVLNGFTNADDNLMGIVRIHELDCAMFVCCLHFSVSILPLQWIGFLVHCSRFVCLLVCLLNCFTALR